VTVRSSERLDIEDGWTGNEQQASFANATLQSTGNDPNMEFSVAVHVEIPASIKSQDQLFGYLHGLFGQVVQVFPSLHVEIKLGPADGRRLGPADGRRRETLNNLADNEEDEAEYHRLRAEAALEGGEAND
jgi:hypothetical protein